MIYLLAFGYGLGPLVGTVAYHGVVADYLSFIAPGMIAVGILFQSFFEGTYGTYVRIRYQRTWHALMTTPLAFNDIFVGDLLWATTKGMLAGLLTGLVAAAWGAYSVKVLLLSLPLIFLGSLLFASLGLLTTGLVRTIDQINIPIFLLVTPMFAFSGTYFPRDVMPTPLYVLANALPLAPLVDLLRWHIGLPRYWLLELTWLVLCVLLAVFLAWRSLRRLTYK